MRPQTFASCLPAAIIVALGATVGAAHAFVDDIDLDAHLASYCEKNEDTFPDPADPIASAYKAPILAACHQSHHFKEAAWTLSMKLEVPSAATAAMRMPTAS